MGEGAAWAIVIGLSYIVQILPYAVAGVAIYLAYWFGSNFQRRG